MPWQKRELAPDRLAANAHQAVRRAIAAGQLAPLAERLCKDCGAAARNYHHFAGYEREHWLDVEPLCCRCHKAHHARPRKIKPAKPSKWPPPSALRMRELRNWTRADLSRRTGLSSRVIARIEDGTFKRPNMTALAVLADYYRCGIDRLIDLDKVAVS